MSTVYFIKPIGMNGPIKIGCSGQVHYRMDTLATWSPFPLELITAVKGNVADERSVHRLFAHLRTHKEWFKSSPTLWEFIGSLKAGSSISEAIVSAKALQREAAE